MEVIKLDKDSPEHLKNILVEMNLEFQEILDEGPEEGKIRRGLSALLSDHSGGHAFLLKDNQGNFIGMVYANTGAGLSCGGKYLWINGIYIRESFTRKGSASFLLNKVLVWAKNEGCIYVIGTRNPDNSSSAAFFARQGFKQYPNMLMDKFLL